MKSENERASAMIDDSGAAVVATPVAEIGKTVHKGDFLDRVSATCDVPRSQVRRIVEATLAELGRALAEGESVILPPFGNARIRRRRQVGGGEVALIRLRRNAAPSARRAETGKS